MDAIIEENGENYSVGERQLICLSRAVLRSSKVRTHTDGTCAGIVLMCYLISYAKMCDNSFKIYEKVISNTKISIYLKGE